MSVLPTTQRLTLRDLSALYKKGSKITMLTAYDAVMAELLEQAGVECILVGDSLGNVVLGHENTIPVTLENMIHHAAAVMRGSKKSFVICDLPFGIASDPERALQASIEIFQKTGAQAVKLEGGIKQASVVRRLTEQGIPVMGHIGLTPQFLHQLGGYYRHGKNESEAELLIRSAREIEAAGAFSIVLECIVPEVAAEITRSLSIPTIGIGSGVGCSGQVLVVNDLIGFSTRPAPKFATRRANVSAEIVRAAKEYVDSVKFPDQSATPHAPFVSNTEKTI